MRGRAVQAKVADDFTGHTRSIHDRIAQLKIGPGDVGMVVFSFRRGSIKEVKMFTARIARIL